MRQFRARVDEVTDAGQFAFSDHRRQRMGGRPSAGTEWGRSRCVRWPIRDIRVAERARHPGNGRPGPAGMLDGRWTRCVVGRPTELPAGGWVAATWMVCCGHPDGVLEVGGMCGHRVARRAAGREMGGL